MASTLNITSAEIPFLGVNLHGDIFQQTGTTYGLATVVVAALTFLAYLSYTPTVDKRSPEFTRDTSPFIGSWGYFSRRW